MPAAPNTIASLPGIKGVAEVTGKDSIEAAQQRTGHALIGEQAVDVAGPQDGTDQRDRFYPV